MIKEVHIIHRDSGVPLVHVDLYALDDHLNVPSAIFSGALQGIRSFLREAHIGDLTEFITEENRIEVRIEKGIVIAIVAELNDPPHNVVERITEDLGALFISQYEEEVEQFDGEVAKFEPFISEIENYIRLTEEKKEITEENDLLDKTLTGIKARALSKNHLDLLVEWAKNRYDPNANIRKEVLISCPPDEIDLPVDILLEGGLRKMNRLDTWMGKRMARGGLKNVVFMIELGASHGPAQIRQMLEKTSYLGDRRFAKDAGIYPWFPAEIAFIGANLEKHSFQGLDDIIKIYKGDHIIVPIYAGHIHREHSPHHEFFRCKISGWKWNLKPITSDNVPVQVFP